MQLWDQPTRGLDSKTALELARTMRKDADNGKSIVMTTYQAGNGIFDEFDKVLVLAEGRVMYYGHRATAKAYFEAMGFVCPRGANVADFLTSVTVRTERIVAQGFEGRVPDTPEEFEEAYQESDVCRKMAESFQDPAHLEAQVEELRLATEQEKRMRKLGSFFPRSVYTAGMREQISNATIRYVNWAALVLTSANILDNSKS